MKRPTTWPMAALLAPALFGWCCLVTPPDVLTTVMLLITSSVPIGAGFWAGHRWGRGWSATPRWVLLGLMAMSMGLGLGVEQLWAWALAPLLMGLNAGAFVREEPVKIEG